MNLQPLSINHGLNLGPAYPITGEVIGTGDGALTNFTFTLANTPLNPGSVTVTDGTETFTDNGDGTLTGDAGGSGTIDYWTGEIDVTFNSSVASAQDVTADYDRMLSATKSVVDENLGEVHALAVENAYDTTYHFGATLANEDIIPGTFSAEVNFSASPVTVSDDGDGNLTGTNVQSGSINYDTGDIFIIYTVQPDDGADLLADYSHGFESDNEKILGRDVNGVKSLEVHNQADGEVGVLLVKSSDLQNWSTVDSMKIGQGNKKFITVAGQQNYLKVVGSGGKVHLQFHQ